MALLAIGRKNQNESKKKDVAQPLPDIDSNAILITESAARRIRELLDEQKPQGIMRVGIVGGGCSGFSYHFAIEDAPRPVDLVFEAHGVRVCVDPKSMKLIGGSMLEWHDKMKRSGFTFRNKRDTKSCSCGESFSI